MMRRGKNVQSRSHERLCERPLSHLVVFAEVDDTEAFVAQDSADLPLSFVFLEEVDVTGHVSMKAWLSAFGTSRELWPYCRFFTGILIHNDTVCVRSEHVFTWKRRADDGEIVTRQHVSAQVLFTYNQITNRTQMAHLFWLSPNT